MKKYFLLLTVVALCAACEYDNYEAPQSRLYGQFTYNGKPFVMDNQVDVLRIYQKGYGKNDVGVSIKASEDGTFSQLLFDGQFYLTLANQRYPYQISEFKSLGNGLGYDTIPVEMKGDRQMNFEVIPYYLIDSVTWLPLDSTSKTLNVTVYMRRNPDSRLPETLPKIQRAFVFASINQHINSETTLTKASRPLSVTTTDNVTMRLELSKYRSSTYYVNNYRNYMYIRVGLALDASLVDNGYYLFSDIYRIENVPYVTE